MPLMDEAVWRGKIYSGGWVGGGGGDAPVTAFTDSRWVTIRSDIATYPF